jgi:hypothetical protein
MGHHLFPPLLRGEDRTPRLSLEVEQFYFSQPIRPCDFLNQGLIHGGKLEEPIDKAGIVNQPLANEIFEQRVSQDGIANVALHRFG